MLDSNHTFILLQSVFLRILQQIKYNHQLTQNASIAIIYYYQPLLLTSIEIT